MCKVVSTCVLLSASIAFILFATDIIGTSTWILMVTAELGPWIRVPEDGQDLSKMNVLSYIEWAIFLSFFSGIGLVFVAIIACCTATCVRSNKGCFYTFSILMILIVGLQGAAAALSYLYSIRFHDQGDTYIRTLLSEKYIGPFARNDRISQAWDIIQDKGHCCGVTGQGIYDKLYKWNRTWTKPGEAKIPVWCCKIKQDAKVTLIKVKNPVDIKDKLQDPHCPVTMLESYTDGCYDIMKKSIDTYRMLIFASCIVLSILEIISICAASFIFPRMQKDPQTVYIVNYKRMGSDRIRDNSHSQQSSIVKEMA